MVSFTFFISSSVKTKDAHNRFGESTMSGLSVMDFRNFSIRMLVELVLSHVNSSAVDLAVD